MNKSIFSTNELNPIKLRSFLRHLRMPSRRSWEIESDVIEHEEPKTDLSNLSKAEARKLYKRILSLKRTVKRVKNKGIVKTKPVRVKRTGVKKPAKRKITNRRKK
tara:strand:- start:15629 stop:15943 length:315 start_codon:yes stop_codon:yes gene_type:complete